MIAKINILSLHRNSHNNIILTSYERKTLKIQRDITPFMNWLIDIWHINSVSFIHKYPVEYGSIIFAILVTFP